MKLIESAQKVRDKALEKAHALLDEGSTTQSHVDRAMGLVAIAEKSGSFSFHEYDESEKAQAGGVPAPKNTSKKNKKGKKKNG